MATRGFGAPSMASATGPSPVGARGVCRDLAWPLFLFKGKQTGYFGVQGLSLGWFLLGYVWVLFFVFLGYFFAAFPCHRFCCLDVFDVWL